MRRKNTLRLLILFAAVGALILSGELVAGGIAEGIELCIKSVIPSLFPFIFLSIQISNHIGNTAVPFLSPIRHLCRLPRSAETLWLLGQLGGYPVGAQAIAEGYRNGSLSKADASRMLGFCCNAGPAFIFGILSGLFSNAATVWALWAIHIFSALLTGCILPGSGQSYVPQENKQSISLPQALEKSLKTMASICGWIILFKAAILVVNKSLFQNLTAHSQAIWSGLLELTNGCYQLYSIPCEGFRFVLSSVFLGFGGVCVLIQTVHVTLDLGLGLYIPGKMLQSLLSFFLSFAAQFLLFEAENCLILPAPILLIAGILLFFFAIWLRFPKKCSISRKNVV